MDTAVSAKPHGIGALCQGAGPAAPGQAHQPEGRLGRRESQPGAQRAVAESALDVQSEGEQEAGVDGHHRRDPEDGEADARVAQHAWRDQRGSLDPHPAVVYNSRYDILGTNPAYRQLFLIPTTVRTGVPNVHGG